jgi:hypothetical protein
MKTNFSRPSLGINQSSLFQASDDIAACSLSRNEFAKNPDLILKKYGLPSVGKCIDIETQKTSEICTVGLGFCVLVAVVAVALGYAAVLAAETVNYVNHIDEVQVYSAYMMSSLSNENYIGIC